MTSNLAEHYRSLVKRYGDSHETAQYSSRESQMRRFAALARVGNLRNKRVLDFGCGTATFAEYLSTIGQTPSLYHGVDVVEEFFDIARVKVPGGVFSTPEALGDARFDYAFVSGVFNNKTHDNTLFWKETLKSLFARCDCAVAFNMMSTYVDYMDTDLFYEDPCRVLDFVKREVTSYVSLHHDYAVKSGSIPFEFAVFCLREPVVLTVS